MTVPIKPRPSTRPKSVSYQNTRKQCAPAPPNETENKTPIIIPNKKNQQSLEDLNSVEEEIKFAQKSFDNCITKSTSNDEIKNQQEYSSPAKQQFRHSFRIISNDSAKALSQNEQEETRRPKKTSPVTKKRKAVDVKAPEKQNIQIETTSNLEELSVKAKIKLMDSFIGTKPICIDKPKERCSSVSLTDSSSSSTSSSVSKSPLISPK